jgi:hypothetical protein
VGNGSGDSAHPVRILDCTITLNTSGRGGGTSRRSKPSPCLRERVRSKTRPTRRAGVAR